MFRELTLQLVLLRFQLPVELRAIVVKNYFLPKSRNPLTPLKLLEAITKPKGFWLWGNTCNTTFVHDPSSGKEMDFFLLLTVAHHYDTAFFKAYIFRGNLEVDVNNKYPIKDEKKPNLYKLKVLLAGITEKTAECTCRVILEWYFDRVETAIQNKVADDDYYFFMKENDMIAYSL